MIQDLLVLPRQRKLLGMLTRNFPTRDLNRVFHICYFEGAEIEEHLERDCGEYVVVQVV